jgi:threonine/homoserine/homoserine lactone efflux protein
LLAPFVAGITTGFVTTMPPSGPVGVLVMAEAARRNVRTALAVGLGATLPMGIWSALGWFGADHLVPDAWVARGRVVGAIVLLLLGLVLLLSKPKTAIRKERGLGRCLALGAMGTGTNPAMLVNFAAISSAWLAIGCPSGGALGAGAFGGGVALGAAAWFGVLTAILGKVALSDRAIRYSVRGLGVVALIAGAGALLLR